VAVRPILPPSPTSAAPALRTTALERAQFSVLSPGTMIARMERVDRSVFLERDLQQILPYVDTNMV
jgi:hypothetical protein